MRQEMQETLYETASAGDTLWDSRCRRHSMGQQIQETNYQTGMQETLHETADAGDTLWDSRCRRQSIRQELQETLYETGDAGNTL